MDRRFEDFKKDRPDLVLFAAVIHKVEFEPSVGGQANCPSMVELADSEAKLTGDSAEALPLRALLEYMWSEGIHDALVADLQAGDHVVIMSNGSFSGLHQQLLQSLTDGASNTEY